MTTKEQAAKELPVRLAVDANGYVWRIFADGTWSMAPNNPDNEPVPEPITFYDAAPPDNHVAISRLGCCAGWPKPCSYHEGYRDAYESVQPKYEEALRDGLRLRSVVTDREERLAYAETKLDRVTEVVALANWTDPSKIRQRIAAALNPPPPTPEAP